MGDVINIDPHAITGRQDEPAHMDGYGRLLLVGAFSDLVKLRDSDVDAHRRKQTEAIVKQISIVLSRYESEGAA